MSDAAPSATSKRLDKHPELTVLMAGIASSALVLGVVSLLEDSGIPVMGVYFFHLVPLGALLVGLFSGLGYAYAARNVNMRLSSTFALGMVFMSLLDYLANQYVEYSSLVERMHLPPQYSFLNYLQDICENMTLKRAGVGQPAGRIGLFGYLFKGLEVLGYVAGSTLPAKMALQSVASTPDCLKCSQYFVTSRCGYLNAPEQWQDLSGLPYLERLLGLKNSCAPLVEKTETMMDALEGKSFAEANEMIRQLDSEAVMGNTASVTFTLRKCPGCDAFHLRAEIVGYEEDGSLSRQRLRSVESYAMSST